MKTITANIPASKVTWSTGGKKQTNIIDARVDVFNMDDNGKWSSPIYGALCELDVIDLCKKASNWKEIRARHFPMHGFHN